MKFLLAILVAYFTTCWHSSCTWQREIETVFRFFLLLIITGEPIQWMESSQIYYYWKIGLFLFCRGAVLKFWCSLSVLCSFLESSETWKALDFFLKYDVIECSCEINGLTNKLSFFLNKTIKTWRSGGDWNANAYKELCDKFFTIRVIFVSKPILSM